MAFKDISIKLIISSLIAIVTFLIILPLMGFVNQQIQLLIINTFGGSSFESAMTVIGYAFMIFVIFALLGYLSFQKGVQKAFFR